VQADLVEPVLNKIQIQGFDVNVAMEGVAYTAEVYVTEGDYEGYENDSAAWTLVQTSEVMRQESAALAPLTLSNSIVVQAGSFQSFYVILTTSNIKFTNGNQEGGVYRSDDSIQFFESMGKTYPFGRTFRPRIFNSNIKYAVLS
jgi:hypothetical protein